MLRWLGASALTIIAVLLIAVVALVPLLFVYRSTCPDGGGGARSYSFVPPWDDPPANCRDHQRGFEIVTDEIGL